MKSYSKNGIYVFCEDLVVYFLWKYNTRWWDYELLSNAVSRKCNEFLFKSKLRIKIPSEDFNILTRENKKFFRTEKGYIGDKPWS